MNAAAMGENPVQIDALDPLVEALDISVFETGDVVNMALQRSEILHDVPRSGRLIKAWIQGDGGPLTELAQARPEHLIRRTLNVIYQEYTQLAPLLNEIGPARLADIGCGYGFFDVFAARDLGCEVVLIDLEENDHRHFGYRRSGAAYSNLAVARGFALANGVAEQQIQLVNPDHDDLAQIGSVDLAVSFMSCGFHYPVTTYLAFFEHQVRASGHVILDLRKNRMEEQAQQLSRLGQVDMISARHRLCCMHLRKAG